MAKKHRQGSLKDTFEWRHKTTLDDFLEVEPTHDARERRLIIGLFWVSLLPFLWTLNPWPLQGAFFFGITLAALAVDFGLNRMFASPSIFICRDGIGVVHKESFHSLEYAAITHVEEGPDALSLVAENARIDLRISHYPKAIIAGVREILNAEGHLGEAYPYQIYFTPDEGIRVEETASSDALSTHERLSKQYRYYEAVEWNALQLEGTRLLKLKRLKDRTAALEFQSTTVTSEHPSNATMTPQKTDGGALVFNAFEVDALKSSTQTIDKPFKTLRSMIEGMQIESVQHVDLTTHVITLKKDATLWTLSFEAASLYVGFNALESDDWYRP